MALKTKVTMRCILNQVTVLSANSHGVYYPPNARGCSLSVINFERHSCGDVG